MILIASAATTLIVALEGQDGLILAADSRGTIGDPRGLTAINDLQQKLFPLSSHCGITISGTSELASYLILKLQQVMQQKTLTNVDDIARETVNVVKTEYFQWFGNRPWASPQPIMAQFAFFTCRVQYYCESANPTDLPDQ